MRMSLILIMLPPSNEYLTGALDTAIKIPRMDWRGKALAGLAPYLNHAQLEKALDAADGSDSEETVSDTLKGLAPHLPEDLLRRAFKMAEGIRNIELARAQVITNLAVRLSSIPSPSCYAIWTELIHSLASSSRQMLLQDIRSLIPSITKLGKSEALSSTIEAIQDAGRYWP
jgi:hypothetical protein